MSFIQILFTLIGIIAIAPVIYIIFFKKNITMENAIYYELVDLNLSGLNIMQLEDHLVGRYGFDPLDASVTVAYMKDGLSDNAIDYIKKGLERLPDGK